MTVMLARMVMMMKLAVLLASLTLEFAVAGELLVNRHFKGDIFSQKGELICIAARTLILSGRILFA